MALSKIFEGRLSPINTLQGVEFEILQKQNLTDATTLGVI